VFKHLRILLAPVVLAIWLVGGCGPVSPEGTVRVRLYDSGTPSAPNIRPPAATRRFQFEVLAADSLEQVIPALESEYAGSGGFEVEVEEVPVGSWVVRLSALDEAGQVLAHLQEGVRVNRGRKVEVEGWLQPGPAAEGLLFVANSSGSSLSIIRLADREVEDLALPQNPGWLFASQGLVYATSSASQVFVVEAVGRSIEVLPAPPGGQCAVGGTSGLFSYPMEGGLRFLDLVGREFSGFYRTGAQAGWISSQVGSVAWVVNPGDQTMTEVDVPARKILRTLNIAYPGQSIEQNPTGDRIYVLGDGRSGGVPPFVRVLEPSGNLVRHITYHLGQPASILVHADRAYLTDFQRGDLPVSRHGPAPTELDRFSLAPGGPTPLQTDGHRLHIAMETAGEVAVVDMATLSLVRRISVGKSPKGLVLVF